MDTGRGIAFKDGLAGGLVIAFILWIVGGVELVMRAKAILERQADIQKALEAIWDWDAYRSDFGAWMVIGLIMVILWGIWRTL